MMDISMMIMALVMAGIFCGAAAMMNYAANRGQW